MRVGRSVMAEKVERPLPFRIPEVLRSQSVLLPKGGAPVRREPRRENLFLAGYTRRSVRNEGSSSLTKQKVACVERAATVGAVIADDCWFFDDDISAAGGHFRPGIESLLVLIKEGHFDGVVVQDITRWTRSEEENRIIVNILLAAGCDIYSYREPGLSLFGPGASSMMLDMFVQNAAAESARLSDRIGGWHALRRQQGLLLW